MYRIIWRKHNGMKKRHTVWFSLDKCIIMAQSIANGGDVVIQIEAKS